MFQTLKSILLFLEIPGPTRKSPNFDNEETDYSDNDSGPGNQFGSAEIGDDDDGGDDIDDRDVTIVTKGRNVPAQNPAQGKQVPGTQRGKGSSKNHMDNHVKIEPNKCNDLNVDQFLVVLSCMLSGLWTIT